MNATQSTYPGLGSISSGTMRTEDLIPDFIWTLQRYAPEVAQGLLEDNQDIFNWLDNPDEIEEPEFTSEFLNEDLWNALNDLAPQYVYFGAHVGDGADYGFWIDWDNLESDCRYADGVIKVNAGDEWPELDDGIEYVLEVTDHGNATLYSRDHKELWSCV